MKPYITETIMCNHRATNNTQLSTVNPLMSVNMRKFKSRISHVIRIQHCPFIDFKICLKVQHQHVC